MDYHELAELCLVYLDPKMKFKFHQPGPVHHARFMGKGIYYMKLKLLIKSIQSELGLSKETVSEIHRMAIFIAVFWAPKFLTSEITVEASRQVILSSIWLTL